jgi:ParB family chromosome partitioning protein
MPFPHCDRRYQNLPINLVQESPDNPRRLFDKAALSELAQSIKVEGLQVPIIVRPIDHGKSYELIAGARRLRASKIAGATEIRSVIRNMSDDEARAARLIENLLRENLQPLEEAEAYQQMLAATGAAKPPLTPAELAAKIGKPESHVRLRLKLVSAEPSVRDALRKQHITAGHALELARLDKSLQKDLLKFCLEDEWGHRREFAISLPQLRQHISRTVMLDLARAPFKTDDATLLQEAGACIDCKNRTGDAALLFARYSAGRNL